MKHRNQVKEKNGHEEKVPVRTGPAHGKIAMAAYSLWMSRDPNECSADEDWYRAEEQLRSSAQ